MKTITKTIVALAGIALLAGCTAAAEKPADQTYGPGWRHQQMAEAWEKGDMPGPMMMRGRMMMQGPGMRGQGPGALGPDGKVDTSKLPAWCPYSTAPESVETK